tara:strand:- start:422 stop:751 length:330 start_codon:yes stop_codon:yes gene_type:complete
MNPAEIALLQNCHRATVTVRIDEHTFRVRIRPSELDGEKFILAMLLDPELAFLREIYQYESEDPVSTNYGIALQERTKEPTVAMKKQLVDMFAAIGLIFVTPVDARKQS